MSKPKYVEPDDYLSPEMIKAFEEADKQQDAKEKTENKEFRDYVNNNK